MKRDDIACYRANYDKKGWLKYADKQGFVYLPAGILDAVRCLCNEVERMRGWEREAKP